MQQWEICYAIERPGGCQTLTETMFAQNEPEIRHIIHKKGGYVIRIHPRAQNFLEQMMRKSSMMQNYLLQGMQFRSHTAPPAVALWRLVESETNPKRQQILAPARESLQRGLGVIDALKSLNIFDHSTLTLLAASERSNTLSTGIEEVMLHTQAKRKAKRQLWATLSWVGFDLIATIQTLWVGRDKAIGFFKDNAPGQGVDLEHYSNTVDNLELLWNSLLVLALIATIGTGWAIFSFWFNRNKDDWPTARMVGRLPLFGRYMEDLSVGNSMHACAMMLKAKVPVADCLKQAATAANFYTVKKLWNQALLELGKGVHLGQALARPPLLLQERLELNSVANLDHVVTVMNSMAEIRGLMAAQKSRMIIMGLFIGSAMYLMIAIGSFIYALSLLNVSMDNSLNQMMMGVM
jgi:type II secretory pathway component PulF